MKRKEEIAIIVSAFVEDGLITTEETDRAKCVTKEALNQIRVKKFAERKTKN